ncbi:MAG: formylglycine-generating enzyme family protein [Nitrospinae bacterium]|nr:formylglycine-generating enzyme family protein [Nitrospinota bacterium]MZH40228.1 formylglycine-generating enzyme family protein [Nitrospinota bacterium]
MIRLFLFLIFLSSCDSHSVKQISVEVPAGITVPEGMVYIPAGEFIMGEPSETKRGRLVQSNAYLIDRFEVSHEAYKKLRPEHTYNPKNALRPVTFITYAEAESFCQAGGKRLPDEIEWEKAARGTDGRKWPWKIFTDHPNNGFSGFMPEPVEKRPEWISPYGVYGMGHNVWEWVTDDYKSEWQAEGENFKVLRGGLLQTHLTIKFSPAWFRNWMDPEEKLNFIGFRCAKDV